MRLKGLSAQGLAFWLGRGLVTALAIAIVLSPIAGAQEGEEGEDNPAEDSAAEGAAAEPEIKKKRHFGLYVFAAAGAAATDEVNSSLQTQVSLLARNTLSFDDSKSAKIAAGWQFADGKGDIRLEMTGFSEDGYSFRSEGLASFVDPSGPSPTNPPDPLRWWELSIENGQISAQRTPPIWNDANLDTLVSPDEISYGDPDVSFTRPYYDNLENRVQTIDIVYGREFGGRRWDGRWYAGMRHFRYDGNIIAAGFLGNAVQTGFTTETTIPLLVFNQQARGNGPTGRLEVRYNMLDQRLQLFLQGGGAFVVNTLEADTGPFSTAVQTNSVGSLQLFPSRLRLEREKSVWQSHAELGARVFLKNGLQFEVAYHVDGYLDVVLLPPEIQIPASAQQGPAGASAGFRTQDFVYDGWRAGVGLQF